jgi:hypothetical protein
MSHPKYVRLMTMFPIPLCTATLLSHYKQGNIRHSYTHPHILSPYIPNDKYDGATPVDTTAALPFYVATPTIIKGV